MNQLPLHCCVTAFIVTKETLLKLLTTFLKKQSPDHAQVIFERSGLLRVCVKYSVSTISDKKFQLLQTLYHMLDKAKEYDVAKSNINGNTKR